MSQWPKSEINLNRTPSNKLPTQEKFTQPEYKYFEPYTGDEPRHQQDNLGPIQIKSFFNYPDKLLKKIEDIWSISSQLNRLQYTFILLEKTQPLPATTGPLILKAMRMFCELLSKWSNADEPKENIPELSRYICTLLHRAGKISIKFNSNRESQLEKKIQPEKVEISAELINFLLRNLLERYEIDFKCPATANALWGISCLVHHRFLTKELNYKYINSLLEKLFERRKFDLDARAIGIALKSVGSIAYCDQLKILNSTHLYVLLEELNTLSHINLDAQAIADAITGIGFLSRSSCTMKKFSALSIEALFAKLTKQNPRPSDIAEALKNSGHIARRKCLIGLIDCLVIEPLLTELAESKPTSKNVVGALIGVGQLAFNNYLTNKLSCEPIDLLLKQLLTPGSNIIPGLIGVGYLAYNNHLIGILNYETINSLLKQHRELHIDKEISPALLAVSYLARQGCFSAQELDFTEINLLCQQLADDTNSMAKEISNAFVAIGSLAAEGFLKRGDLSGIHINSLLTQFMFIFEIDTIDIVNILRGIGYFVRRDCLEGELTCTNIDSLLHRLSQREDLEPQIIAYSLLAVGYLILTGKYNLNRNDSVTNQPFMEIIQNLLDKFIL